GDDALAEQPRPWVPVSGVEDEDLASGAAVAEVLEDSPHLDTIFEGDDESQVLPSLFCIREVRVEEELHGVVEEVIVLPAQGNDAGRFRVGSGWALRSWRSLRAFGTGRPLGSFRALCAGGATRPGDAFRHPPFEHTADDLGDVGGAGDERAVGQVVDLAVVLTPLAWILDANTGNVGGDVRQDDAVLFLFVVARGATVEGAEEQVAARGLFDVDHGDESALGLDVRSLVVGG